MALNNETKKGKKIISPGRRWIYWVMGLLLLNFVISYFFNNDSSIKEISWQKFRSEMLMKHDVYKLDVINKERAEVYIKKDSLRKTTYSDLKTGLAKKTSYQGPHYYFTIGSLEAFEQHMESAQANFIEGDKVPVNFVNQKDWRDSLYWLLPIGGLLFLWFIYSNRMGMAERVNNTAMEFGKSHAEEYGEGKISPFTFKDVAGYEEAKAEVMEIVDFLKYPERFTKLGAKIPKGVLLVGPPGTGKTLMAKAVAGEAAVPFFSLSGSEFIELFVGVGASRVRDLFDRAKQKAPSIVFIDEIDTVGRVRGKAVSMQVNDERESTLNQLLSELDGFDSNTGVIVMAATNRADVLDPALLRPGRFDRHIYLELPNKQERESIFNVHLKPLILDVSVTSKYLASQTPGFSGADIANVCNEAALIAARGKKETVDLDDFTSAVDRVIGGLEKKTMIIAPSEKNRIAYHEAGHAIVSWTLKHIDPLIKISIIPRGQSLGGAWYLPEERQIVTKAQFVDQLCATLGGRAAEEVVFKDISSGALDDLEKVTKQAYSMVLKLGLSEKIGNLSFYDSSGTYENAFQKPYSEATGQLIDSEVQKLVSDAYQHAIEILLAKREQLDVLANLLLAKEILDRNEIESVLGKREEGDAAQ